MTSLETKIIRKEAEIDKHKTMYNSRNSDFDGKMQEYENKLKVAQNQVKMKELEQKNATDQNSVAANEYKKQIALLKQKCDLQLRSISDLELVVDSHQDAKRSSNQGMAQ